jgi:transposase
MPLNDITNNTSNNVTVKRKRLTDYELGTVIGHYESGLMPAAIGRLLNRPRTTIAAAINLYQKTGSPKGKTSTGRPKKLSQISVRALVRSVRANPFEPYRFHTEALENAGVNVSRDAIIRKLKEEGIGSFSPAMKPALTDKHKKRRLAWAKDKVDWTNEQWRSVIWSDESRFTVMGNDGGVRVLRKVNERYEERHIVSTVKFGKGSVMIWGCFWAGGVGPLKVMDDSFGDFKCILTNNKTLINRITLNVGLYLLRIV